MKGIRENCIAFFQDEQIRSDIRFIIKPLIDSVYSEVSIYIWIICFYNLFLAFIILANLFLLYKLVNSLDILPLPELSTL
jgi:hypothetical protein|tara:strand:- start:3508 stop:3747 length:240 start_codon:yes stop_codon:yes gene_type:complete